MESQQTIHAIQLDPASLSLLQSLACDHDADVATHASVEEFLSADVVRQPGCIVLRLADLDEGTLPVIQQLRRATSLPILVVVERTTVPLAVRAVREGAADVLEHPPARPLLEKALGEALRQERQQRATRRRREQAAARLAALTQGEREVLDRLMEGMPNKNIAVELQLGLRTVELRRAKILKKLGAKSLAEMVRLVLLAEPEQPEDS